MTFTEKQLLYSNPFVKDELSAFLKKYDKNEKLFIVYLLLKAKQDFLFFCKLFYPFCSDGNNLAVHDGIKIECAVLQLHFERKIDCPIIINTCPGHGKSTIIDVLYSAFLLFNDDKQRIRTYTSSAKTLKDNLAYFLSVVGCELYKFGANHKKTSLNNNGYTINGFLAKAMRTIKTGIGGENATQVIVDDANDPAKIIGADFANTNNAILRSGLTRQRPREGTRPPIFTQQRVSTIDNTAYLKEQFEKSHTQYLHIVIKQFEEQDVIYKIPLADGTQFEITRKAGNLWDAPFIMRIVNLNKVNQYVYLTQYQQMPQEASIYKVFDEKDFIETDILKERVEYAFITTDLSWTKDGDNVCICVWFASKDKLILVDGLYLKLDRDVDRVKIVYDFYEKYKNFILNKNRVFFEYVIVEENGNAPILREFKGLRLLPVKRQGGKTDFSGTKKNRVLTSYNKNVKTIYYDKNLDLFFLKSCQAELKTVSLDNIGTSSVHDDFCDNLLDAIVFFASRRR